MSEVLTDTEQLLPPEQRRRGQKFMIRTAVSNTIFAECTKGTMGQLFILTMGASAWHIGLLATLLKASPLAQIIGLRILPRTGKSRLASTGYMLAMLPLTGLLVMCLSGWSGVAAVFTGIAAYASLSFIGSFANTAWWPLLQDVTSGDPKGAFFARLRTRLRTAELIVPILLGWYVAQVGLPWKFFVPFLVGGACSLLAVSFIRRVPERELAVRGHNLLLRLQQAFRVKSVRAYLYLVFQYFFLTSVTNPFIILVLLDRGMSAGFVIWMEAFAAVGNVAGLQLWARAVDTHGGRPALSMTVCGMSTLGLAWLLLPNAVTHAAGTGLFGQFAAMWPLMLWAIAFYMLWGFFQGGFLMGRTQFLLDAVPTQYQADGFTMVNLAMAAGGGMGAFVGGLGFNWLTMHKAVLLGFDGRVLYLAAGQLLLITLWRAKTQLTGHDEQTSARQYLASAWRSIRGNEDVGE